MIDDDISGLRIVSEARQPRLESVTSILSGRARLRVAQRKVSLNGGFRADVPNTQLKIAEREVSRSRRRQGPDSASGELLIACLS